MQNQGNNKREPVRWKPMQITNPSTRLRQARSMPQWVTRDTTPSSVVPPPPPDSTPPVDPDYEVIEFSGHQPYSNTEPVMDKIKKSKNPGRCDLCGSSIPTYTCDQCPAQHFCASCDEMYHRHPKRQSHIRKPLDISRPPFRPPLPPKGEFMSAPVAPPRRKQSKSSRFSPSPLSNQFQLSSSTHTLKKEPSGLIGSLKRFMGGRPLPPPPHILSRDSRMSQPTLQLKSMDFHDSNKPSSCDSGYLDWDSDRRNGRSGSFSAINNVPAFGMVGQAQSMAQLTCPSCHHPPSPNMPWNDWNSTMNLNAMNNFNIAPPQTNPWNSVGSRQHMNTWHGSQILPTRQFRREDDFSRRNSLRNSSSRRSHKDSSSDFSEFRQRDPTGSRGHHNSSSEDETTSRGGHRSQRGIRSNSPAMSYRSRRDQLSDIDSENDTRSRRGGNRRRRNKSPIHSSPAMSRKSTRHSPTFSRKGGGRRSPSSMSMSHFGRHRSRPTNVGDITISPTFSRTRNSYDSDSELSSDNDKRRKLIKTQSSKDGKKQFVRSLSKSSKYDEFIEPKQNSNNQIKYSIDSKPLNDGWECEHCTFVNTQDSKVCSVCCKTSTSPAPALVAATVQPNNNVEEKVTESIKNINFNEKKEPTATSSASSKQQSMLKKGRAQSIDFLDKTEVTSTGTSHPPQSISTQTYDYAGNNRLKRATSLSDEIWRPISRPNSRQSTMDSRSIATSPVHTSDILEDDRENNYEIQKYTRSQSQLSQRLLPDQTSSHPVLRPNVRRSGSQPPEYFSTMLQNQIKQGMEMVKLLREAEQNGFTAEDLTIALSHCGESNPVTWLINNWRHMIDTVVTLATNYGQERAENNVGTLSAVEARDSLRLHNGNVWAAVTECVETRQKKFNDLMSKGTFVREDVVTALTANHGNIESAFVELNKTQLKPFLMRIWGPPQGLDNDCGDVSRLHIDDDANSIDINNELSEVNGSEVSSYIKDWCRDDDSFECKDNKSKPRSKSMVALNELDYDDYDDSNDEIINNAVIGKMRLRYERDIEMPQVQHKISTVYSSNVDLRINTEPIQYSDTTDSSNAKGLHFIDQEDDAESLTMKNTMHNEYVAAITSNHRQITNKNMNHSSREYFRQASDPASNENSAFVPYSSIKNSIESNDNSNNKSILIIQIPDKIKKINEPSVVLTTPLENNFKIEQKQQPHLKKIKEVQKKISDKRQVEDNNYVEIPDQLLVPKAKRSSELYYSNSFSGKNCRKPSISRRNMTKSFKKVKTKLKSTLSPDDKTKVVKDKQINVKSTNNIPIDTITNEQVNFRKEDSSIENIESIKNTIQNVDNPESKKEHISSVHINKIDCNEMKISIEKRNLEHIKHVIQNESIADRKESLQRKNEPVQLIRKKSIQSEDPSKASNIYDITVPTKTENIEPCEKTLNKNLIHNEAIQARTDQIKNNETSSNSTRSCKKNKKNRINKNTRNQNKSIDSKFEVPRNILTNSSQIKEASNSNTSSSTADEIDRNIMINSKEETNVQNNIEPNSKKTMNNNQKVENCLKPIKVTEVNINDNNKPVVEKVNVEFEKDIVFISDEDKRKAIIIPQKIKFTEDLSKDKETINSVNKDKDSTEDVSDINRNIKAILRTTIDNVEIKTDKYENPKSTSNMAVKQRENNNEMVNLKNEENFITPHEETVNEMKNKDSIQIKTNSEMLKNTIIDDRKKSENTIKANKDKQTTSNAVQKGNDSVEEKDLEYTEDEEEEEETEEEVAEETEYEDEEKEEEEEDEQQKHETQNKNSTIANSNYIEILEENNANQILEKNEIKININSDKNTKNVKILMDTMNDLVKEIMEEKSNSPDENSVVIDSMKEYYTDADDFTNNTFDDISTDDNVDFVSVKSQFNEIDSFLNEMSLKPTAKTEIKQTENNIDTIVKDNLNQEEKKSKAVEFLTTRIAKIQLQEKEITENNIRSTSDNLNSPIEIFRQTNSSNMFPNSAMNSPVEIKEQSSSNIFLNSPNLLSIDRTGTSSSTDIPSDILDSTSSSFEQHHPKEQLLNENTKSQILNMHHDQNTQPGHSSNKHEQDEKKLTMTENKQEILELLKRSLNKETILEDIVNKLFSSVIGEANTTTQLSVSDGQRTNQNTEHGTISNNFATNSIDSIENRSSSKDELEVNQNILKTSAGQTIALESEEIFVTQNTINVTTIHHQASVDLQNSAQTSQLNQVVLTEIEAAKQSITNDKEFVESDNILPQSHTSSSPVSVSHDGFEFEREVRRCLAEGLVSNYDQAELAVKLMRMKFDRELSVAAASECSTEQAAIAYLQQECTLCAGKYPMKEMVSMLECEHQSCKDCAFHYFTLTINEKGINDCVCPFCNSPDLKQFDDDRIMNYFGNLDILLKSIIETNTHELFQRKLRDRTLMQDPNFKWCTKCSSGYIAHPRQKKFICPDCHSVTCAKCNKAWTKEHEGKTCEEYDIWLELNDPNSQISKHLIENDGINCPKCKSKYALAKGGCMHMTCPTCKYEFCSDCGREFLMGSDCKVSQYCEKLGLHSHHPRNCLFYLRDKEPKDLQKLLKDAGIDFKDGTSSTQTKCSVQLQKETADGLLDTTCKSLVESAGMCRTHYIEYLAKLINKFKLDPVVIFELNELQQELRRKGKPLPERSGFTTDQQYHAICLKIIQEEIPLP